MELEVREVEASQRPRLRTRVDSYQAELRRLKQDFQNASSTSYIEGISLLSAIEFSNCTVKMIQVVLLVSL